MAQILIVDDDRVMLKYLSDSLKQAGHEIQTADNGVDALEYIKEYNVDLLLTDIVMPGMDGISLSKKASAISSDLKILFMTGFSVEGFSKGKLNAMTEKVVSKPFHLKDIVAQVENMLTGN